MSRKTRTDYNNVFDIGIDNMSDLVHQFTKKNKRVHRIFEEDDDDVQVNNDQSYGLRLVSVHENEASDSKPVVNDKENGNKQARRSSTTNVRPLSPVQIVEALAEQISESRGPFKHPSQLTNRQNVSLRRSLFRPQNKNNDLICSTPSTRNNNNQGTSNDFFGASSSRIEGLSPIRKGLSETVITIDDLRGIELIEPENNRNGQNVAVVQSLQDLENNLREQFQIEQGTPKKTYSKSLAGETSRRSVSETKNAPSPSRRSLQSEPISLSQPAKNCSVVVEPMEISKDTISMYRKSQLSRLSTSNLTNVNTFNMIETPIARQTKHSVINDSLLAKKLALCESDSEITDDESEKSRTSTKHNKSKKQKTVENEAILTNDESDKVVESPKRRKISQHIEITPKKTPSRRPSRQSAPKRLVDPLEVQNNITNDDSDHDDQQFELIIDENPQIINQQIVETPKKISSRRPSKDVAAASQKSKKDVQEGPKKPASSQKSKKSVREAQNTSSDESDEERPAKKDKNRHKNSQQVVASPIKLPSRRPSKDVMAESQKTKKTNLEVPKTTAASHKSKNTDSEVAASSQKSKKIDQIVNDSSDESEDERPAKKDKNHKKNAVEPKKKASEKKKSVHVTETSQDMEFSESEEEEPAATKKSKQMSISDDIRRARKSTKSTEQMSIPDDIRRARKSTKSTEQMNMSESESEDEESTQQDTRNSTQNSEQMSVSDDEQRLVIDLKENRKPKGNRNRQQSPIVDESMSDGDLTDKLPEPEESEEESPLKVQQPKKEQTAEKFDKKSQKGSKKSQKEIHETKSSETVYSDVSLSNYTSPAVPEPTKAKKPASKVNEKVPDPPKSKKNAKSKKIESEESESDEEPAANVKKIPDPPKNKKNAKSKNSVSEQSESDDEPRNQPTAQEIEPVMQFKKPQLFKKSLRETISCNLSNVSAGSLVPTEIAESFRTLQKPVNNTASIVPESSKLSRPKGSKSRNVNPNKEKIAEYLRLEKSVKHKKSKNDTTKSKKRTLFNQNSDDDEPESSVATNVDHEIPEIDPIDHELSEELINVRRSIDTMSNASSQPFNATIPTQNASEDESEEEHPVKKGKQQTVVDESDQEMEEVQQPKKSRGRPKKNVTELQAVKSQGQSKKKEVPATKQQVTATDESDEVSEDDSRQKATKTSKKTAMSKELMALTRRPATKRQNNTTDDTEPPSKTRRRAAAATSDESNSETSKNTDEGFQSDEVDDYDDVWYDPIERGCQRQGLRVRKFTKSKDGRFAIQYGVFTRNDSKATQLQQKYKIKESELHEPSLAPFIQPANKLELIQTLIMERKLKKKIDLPKKKEIVAKKKAVERINDGASTSRQAMDTESLASFTTTRTNETQSGIINKLLDNFSRVKEDNTNAINVVETATYAISQINKLEWHPIGAGVFYSSFKENSFDGFLRLVKGGYKKGAKTKLAVVKMTLLCGVVDIKINGTKIRIENLGFITITRGQSYRIENVSDETAIILMTRLDEEESIPNQTNSLS